MRRVIHWGVPNDVESYLQETGRAGRDGEQAILYYGGRDMYGVDLSDAMKDYCQCRLLGDFNGTQKLSISPLTDCSCCDVCSLKCNM